jgi:hypothetical protein
MVRYSHIMGRSCLFVRLEVSSPKQVNRFQHRSLLRGCIKMFKRMKSEIVSFQHGATRGTSVSIATGYGLHDRSSRVRISAGTENFSLLHCAKTGSSSSFQPPIQWVPGVLSKSGWVVKLTTHLLLVLRSRMRGCKPPFPNTSSCRGA